MNEAPKPFYTLEHELYYLWRPEPQANHIQLAGEFKSETEMQAHSMVLFAQKAEWRTAK